MEIRRCQYLLSSVAFMISFWFVTYTADWAGYEYFFNNEDTIKGDLAFSFLTQLLKSCGFYDYSSLFHLHIILMGIIFPIFFYKVKENPLPYTLLYILLYYVPLANQIRYYVAFPLSLLALYYILYRRKYLVGIVITLLSFLFHRTIIIFIIIGVFFSFLRKRIKAPIYVLLGNLVVFLFFPFIYGSSDAEAYSTYRENISSVFGGIYNMIPSVIAIAAVVLLNSKVKGINDKKYGFLLTLSLASTVLLLLSLRIQILCNRMISPLAPIWVLYFSYCMKKGYVTKKLGKIVIWGIVFIFLSWNTYVPYLLGISNTLVNEEMLLIIASLEPVW